MDTGVDVVELKKVRRIGKYSTDRIQPRPMLLEFENKKQRDEVHTKAKTLYKRLDELKDYRLVPDLTDQQRNSDREVKAYCDKANTERSVDERKTFEWKPVGNKGSKKAAKVLIKHASDGGSSRDHQGQEQRTDWRERARKRYETKE